MPDAEVLFAEGNSLADIDNHPLALTRFKAAWDALPEPRDRQDVAIDVLIAIADTSFHLGEWNACCDAVQHAFRCGADSANPFIRLRLGQALFELGNEREAINWFVPAFLSEGRALFEYDSPKYLESFYSKLDPPPGGWPNGW